MHITKLVRFTCVVPILAKIWAHPVSFTNPNVTVAKHTKHFSRLLHALVTLRKLSLALHVIEPCNDAVDIINGAACVSSMLLTHIEDVLFIFWIGVL